MHFSGPHSFRLIILPGTLLCVRTQNHLVFDAHVILLSSVTVDLGDTEALDLGLSGGR